MKEPFLNYFHTSSSHAFWSAQIIHTVWKDPCHLVAAGFKSRPTPRHGMPASPRLFGMLCRGLWEVRGLFLLLACLFWKSMQGMALPLRQSWQGSQGLSMPSALEMGSPYQVDVCPAIICLRNFTRYHVTCYQSTPPSSLLYLHFTEGKLRPWKIKWLAKGHTPA